MEMLIPLPEVTLVSWQFITVLTNMTNL